MKAKQIILLSIALILPVAIFLFLKGFGKNEFHVPPMFTKSVPTLDPDCNVKVSAPYAVSRGELEESGIEIDSIACVSFFSPGGTDPLTRVKEEYTGTPLKFYTFNKGNALEKKQCIFLLLEPFDIALVDNKGRIRGQYNSSKRDEIDRLITEVAIILKKY